MAADDPKQVIVEYISQPVGELDLNPSQAPTAQSNVPQAMVRRGGGLGARISTVQFLQERHLSDRQLHLVAFENQDGEREQWLLCVREIAPDHWQNAGGASISAAEVMPQRNAPWVNLASGWSGDLFWAGGRVLDNGLDVVRVRLISENGVVLEDEVQDGLVLFVANQSVQRPLRVELFDRSGKLVGTHQAFKLPE